MHDVPMSELRLPPSLSTADDGPAGEQLRRYYFGAEGAGRYDGSLFDTWDPSGNREADRNTFTSDDFTALTFLSIKPEARSLTGLLVDHRDQIQELLTAIPTDIDLAAVDIDDLLGGPANELYELMRPFTGTTTRTKLLARKRPRLFPIRDSVVVEVMGIGNDWWAPLHALLNVEGDDGLTLHARLAALQESLALPGQVSPLRVLDVVAWMDGTSP